MTKRYADLTPDQIARRNAAKAKYEAQNPERVRAAKAAWFAKNPGYFNEWTRRDQRANPWRYVLRLAKLRARRENVPFSLTTEDIVVPDVCPVLGIKIVPYTAGTTPRHNSNPTLDRVVPSRGYTKENTHVISFRANRLKSNATLAELKAIVAYMESHGAA